MTTLTIHSGELKDEGEGPDGWSYAKSDRSVGIWGDYVWHSCSTIDDCYDSAYIEIVPDHITSERISDWQLATKAVYHCRCGAALIWRYKEYDPIDVPEDIPDWEVV